MATYSSILARGIPWMEEATGLQFMGSQRVGHDLATKQQKEMVQMNSFPKQKQTYRLREHINQDRGEGQMESLGLSYT